MSSNQKEDKENKKIQLPYLDDFLLSLQTNNYSEETIYNYERDLQVFANFLKDIGKDFSDIDKKTVLNYKAYLTSQDRKTADDEEASEKLSSFSINRMLSALRSYLKFLTDMEYEVPVPPDTVELIKTEKKHPRVSSFKKIVKLLEAPSELEKDDLIAARNRAMLEVLFSTGMRISELLKIKKNQINKRGRIFIKGKGKKERFVYLTPRAKKFLRKYLEKRGEDEYPYLFIPFRGKNANKKDKHISPNYLQEKIKEYRERLNIETPISAHSLRHAFATYLAESGANAAAIQTLLGHESLDTTTRYVQPSDKFAEKSHKKYHPLKDTDEENLEE